MKTMEIGEKLYVKICDKSDIIENRGYKFQFPDDIDMQVVIFYTDGEYFCVSNICPHKHQPVIHKGFIKNCTVTCPAHGWTYELDSGNNTNKHQGIKQLRTYEVKVINDEIYIEKPKLEIPKWRQ